MSEQANKNGLGASRQATESFENLLHASTVGIVVTDAKQEIILVNGAFCDLFGCSSQEMLKTNLQAWVERLGPEAAARWAELDRSVRLAGAYRDIELQIATQRGAKDVTVSVTRLEGATGESGLTASLWRDVTALKQAEQKLQESEEWRRGLIETMRDGLCVEDENGVVVYANNRLCEMSGYSREELIGRSVARLLREGAKGPFKAQTACRKDGESGSHQMTLVCKDGREMPTIVSRKPILGDEDRFKGSSVVITDITDRKRMEENLLASAQQWRATFDAIEDAVSILSSEGKLERCNKAMERLVGRPFFEIIVLLCHEVVHGAACPIEGCPVMRMKATHSRQSEALQMGERWFDVVVDPMLDEEGRIIGAVHIMSDITERRRTEEELREREQRYRGIFNESVAAIFVFDAEKRFIDANQSGLDLLGYSREELLKMSIPDVDADPEAVLPAHNRLLSGERIVNYEHQLRRKDGSVITVLNNSRPLTDEKGNVIGLQSTLIDITERKHTEEALRLSSERLKTLRGIDQAILSAQSAEAVAQAALERISGLIPSRRRSVALFDFAAHEGAIVAVHADGESSLREGGRFPLDRDAIGEMARGRVHLVADVSALPQKSPTVRSLEAEGIRSFIAVPLIVQGELIGALNIGADWLNAFSSEHIEIAREVAAPLAIAIQHARLDEQARRNTDELEARVRERTAELEKTNKQLRTVVNAMAGREVRMAELKGVIRELRAQLEEAGLTPVAEDPLAEKRET